MMAHEKYRLVTRSDFDGLVCAVLLNELDLIDDIKFVTPKTCRTARSRSPIATSRPTCLTWRGPIWLSITTSRKRCATRASAATTSSTRQHRRPPAWWYNYYGGKARFPGIADDMMAAVDKADAAQFSQDEILNPQGWVLLNYLMDARTGLGASVSSVSATTR